MNPRPTISSTKMSTFTHSKGKTTTGILHKVFRVEDNLILCQVQDIISISSGEKKELNR